MHKGRKKIKTKTKAKIIIRKEAIYRKVNKPCKPIMRFKSGLTCTPYMYIHILYMYVVTSLHKSNILQHILHLEQRKFQCALNYAVAEMLLTVLCQTIIPRIYLRMLAPSPSISILYTHTRFVPIMKVACQSLLHSMADSRCKQMQHHYCYGYGGN